MKNRVVLAWALLLGLALPIGAWAKDNHWIGTWATAPGLPGPFDPPVSPPNDQTIRQIAHISNGGKHVRVRFSNVLGTAPLTISAASIARQTTGAAIDANSLRSLTFGGQSSISVAVGARVWSDPVRLALPNLANVSVSLYLAEGATAANSPVTGHVAGLQTNYVMSGNQTEAIDPVTDSTTQSYTYFTGIDVQAHRFTPVLAVLGDSITDGTESTPDANQRWLNQLAQRIFTKADKKHRKGVRQAGLLNLGIAGNQITQDLIGPNGQARFDRDILTQSGVTHAMVLLGINDIGLPAFANIIGIPLPLVSAEAIIAAHQQLVQRARARGLQVIGATLPPAGNFALPDYNTPTGEAKRQAVNAWIRDSGAYDVVVDFDAVLRDPDDATVMRADLSADGLHPNDAGYAAMAAAFPLKALR